MIREPVQPATIRRKVEAWLSEGDSQMALALRATPVWDDEPILTVGENANAARVVPCPTPIAVRAALHDRREGERLVLLTELTDLELGDGLLAHLSRGQIRSVDRWDLVRQMFKLTNLDPTIVSSTMGGGGWIADALAQYQPREGWPPPPGTVLTRDHVLRCLSAQLLGLDRGRLDSAGLLQWTTDAHSLLQFSHLPSDVLNGITGYLTEIAGPAVAPIMAAVRSGHGVDAIPLGLLAAALWPVPNGAAMSTDVIIARTRLEPYFGGERLTDEQAYAFRVAAEAWVDRALDSDRDAGLLREVHRVFNRAEDLAKKVDAAELLAASDLLPLGFTHRLRAFTASIRRALPTKGRVSAEAVLSAQHALEAVERHRGVDNQSRVDTARMAVRLLRWLSTPEPAAPQTLLEAVWRHVREDGWVDRARLDLFVGDTDPGVAQAYRQLYHSVDQRRALHDHQFANLLATSTAAESEPGTLLRVEDVLDRVVAPILERHPVLLLVMDGMSVAAATELVESVTRSGSWLELTPDGGARTGVLAALPSVTEVSRCSLLSGRIAVGKAQAERAAFTQRFPKGMLLHKGSLRAGAGSALDSEVVEAVANRNVPLVAAVVNTIDDALDRSEPDTIVWGQENIAAVRALLEVAQDRVVVLVSDHGHVLDRGPDSVTRTSPSSENRWRPSNPPAGDGEIAIHGSRVGLGNSSVVLPWREELRYGPRKSGYHGGASPAEVVIPLIVLSAGDDQAVPGWSGAPVASPDWWREALTGAAAVAAAPVAPRRPAPKSDQDLTLFDETPKSTPAPEQSTKPKHPALVEAFLASEIYRQRQGTRAPLPNERVAALLTVLLAGGGRATLDTMAAHAGVPAHRIGGTVTALRKLLQVEGYPVLDIDADGQTVKLDTALLIEQFDLEQM
ncbi:BREX-2 system phosphatase PglZ [Nocardia sp. NBC_00881]|uniref:BREX-2 system phosphatase PglZ n=1 Tax=Nocardia sp. NBC_00881 TaxID=2975995 RepID=UPI00386E093C|nr:BREX-2 system phosphatase PglZ [Nocardia sp. NBC_00881]